MSYNGYSGYGAYYGTTSSGQNAQNGYGSARPNVPPSSYTNSVGYSNEAQKSQYPPQDYAWSAQDQQSYNSTGEQQQFSGDVWRDSSGGGIYDYRRQHVDQSKSNDRTSTSYATNTSQAPAQSGTQALNSLAYASGLESVQNLASQNPSSSISAPQRAQSSLQNTGRQQTRACSPKLPDQNNYSGQSQTTLQAAQHNYRSSSHEQIANAAAALAATSGHKYNSPSSEQAKSVSPAMGSASSVLALLHQRQNSPYTGKSNVAHNWTSSSDSQATLKVPGTSSSAATPAAGETVPATPRAYNTVPNPSRPNSAQQTGSITSLVTNESCYESPVYQNTTTFINPREIFNPYHLEHERARQKIAAAEEALRIKSSTLAPTENPTPKSAPSATPSQSFTNTANVTKPIASKLPKAKATPALNETSKSAISEAETAAELRAMMDRMKELRNKDPNLFQQIWDEGRKGPPSESGGSTMNTTKTVSPQISRPTAQLAATRAPSSTPDVALSAVPDAKGHNSYKVVIENNPKDLPDRGRFPAERRIRYSHKRPEGTRDQGAQPLEADTAWPQVVGTPSGHMSAVAQSQGPLVFNTKVTPDTMPMTNTASANPGTLWPEELRKDIAQASIGFLMSKVDNSGLRVLETDIVTILAQNPTYMALCEVFEKRGFKFDRRPFAQALIAKMPHLASGKTRTTPSPAVQTRQAYAPTTVATTGPITQNQPAPDMEAKNSQARPVLVHPSFDPQHRSLSQHHSLKRQSSLRPVASAPKFPVPVPGSKEDLARKRDFNDLIDLTQLSDDDDYVMPSKRARMNSPSPDPIEQFASVQQQNDSLPRLPTGSFVNLESAVSSMPNSVTPLRFDAMVLQQGKRSQLFQPPQRPQAVYAEKLNKAEALRRSYYDPKTVARDVLIAAGRHPTERPLNAHMAGLLGSHIELDSDLNTFNWEDIDPGGPPPPQVAWTDILAGPPKAMRPGRRGHAPGQIANKLSQTGITDPRYTALKKLLDSSEDLKESNSNSPSSRPYKMQKTKTDDGQASGGPLRNTAKESFDLGRRDSSPAARGRARAGLIKLSQQTKDLYQNSLPKSTEDPRPSSQLRQSLAATEHVGKVSVNIVTPPKRMPGRQSLSTASPNPTSASRPSMNVSERSQPTGAPQTERSFWPSGKPRGRPPGAKNKNPPVSKMPKKADQFTNIEVRIPSSNPAVGFPVFKCRWKSCGTELHNLPTLRKHVAKAHRASDQKLSEDGGHVCWWKKCSLLHQDEEGSFIPSKTFEKFDQWYDHINAEHIFPLTMKLGDGPSTGKQKPETSETIVSKYFYQPHVKHNTRTVSYTDPQALAQDRAVYLTDDRGRTTTHLAPEFIKAADNKDSENERDALVLMDQFPTDYEERKEVQATFKNFLKAHGNEKMEARQAAREIIRGLTARKVQVGVAIDRGGCTLINDARRATFVQNPQISRVVENDE